MHTRSHLILQDIDLLKAFGKSLEVGVSITTDREDVRKEFEPGAPSISRRLKVLRTLHENGIQAYVSFSPLLPCNPKRLAQLVSPYVRKGWTDNLHYMDVMQKPDLMEKYKDWFDEKNHAAARSIVKQIIYS